MQRSIAALQREACGFTKTYNRFHDPHEKSLEIAHLRELHAAMDRAVLEAYGWNNLAQSALCEFLLDYEEEDDDDVQRTNDQGRGTRHSRKKKPWRLRWPDDFRDEVLARLLELNESLLSDIWDGWSLTARFGWPERGRHRVLHCAEAFSGPYVLVRQRGPLSRTFGR